MLSHLSEELVRTISNHEIKEILSSLNICSQCLNRVSNCRLIDDSSLLPDCILCLGITSRLSTVASEISSLYNSSGYSGTSTFIITLNLPNSSLIVRNHFISLYLADKLDVKVTLLSEVVPLKELIKQILAPLITTQTTLEFIATSQFHIEIEFTYQETEQDYTFISKIPSSGLIIKKTRSRDAKMKIQPPSNDKIQAACSTLSIQDYKSNNQHPPKTPLINSIDSCISFSHASIYLAGRYNKLKRNISNSPWTVNNVLMCPDSVEGLISPYLKNAFNAVNSKFCSSGREDSDVLMLGTGRPFYFELIKPKIIKMNQNDITSLEDLINKKADSKIFIRDLQLVSKLDTNCLKDSASTKCKSYSILVRLPGIISNESLDKLSSQKDLQIQQQNPLRVARRADLLREKVIHNITVVNADDERKIHPEAIKFLSENPIDDEYTIVRAKMKTSAGTYVKEFVHSDQGRTVPSFKSIFNVEFADVIALDVLDVALDWPSSLEYPEGKVFPDAVVYGNAGTSEIVIEEVIEGSESTEE